MPVQETTEMPRQTNRPGADFKNNQGRHQTPQGRMFSMGPLLFGLAFETGCHRWSQKCEGPNANKHDLKVKERFASKN